MAVSFTLVQNKRLHLSATTLPLMAALSLVTGPVVTAPKCVIGIPLIGVCVGATEEPTPPPISSPPIAPTPAPATEPTTAPFTQPEPAPPAAPEPTEQWQPRNEAPKSAAPLAPQPTNVPWTTEPSEEAVVTGPAEGIPTPVSMPSTAPANIQPEQEVAKSSATTAPSNPLTEQASENTKGTDLNAVLIGTILVHLGIALIWFALFHLPALWNGTKTVVVKAARPPRHLSPRRGTP
jgi:outer membrane biosynthesis protein TonB